VEHPTNTNPNKPNSRRTLVLSIIIFIAHHSLISFQAAWEKSPRELSYIASRVILIRIVEHVIVSAIEEQTYVQTDCGSTHPLGLSFGINALLVTMFLGSLPFVIGSHRHNIARKTPRHRKNRRRPDFGV
jgi:hypothetical protein